jgi:hypothetical protein
MARITDYTALTTTQPDDLLPIVDVHDFTQAGTGSTKKITVANLVAAVTAVDITPGLIQQFVQWSAAANTFPAVPGVLHLASAAGGNITMQLPAAASVQPGSALVVKRVDSSGNTVTVAPVTGEKVNGLTAGVVLSQQGQGRWFMPGAPAGAAAGTGWMSF